MPRSSMLLAPQDPPARGRAALRAWLARIAAGTPRSSRPRPWAPGLATGFENRVRALRADAHAAYHSVEGGADAALDAALAVLEAEWQSTRAERDGYAEALKAIRVYARDTGTRTLAERALRGEAAPPTDFPSSTRPLAEVPGRPVGPLILACGGAAGLAALVLATGGGLLPALAAYSLGGAGLLLAPVAKAAMAARPRRARRRRRPRRPAPG